jgi:hypothetical protein
MLNDNGIAWMIAGGTRDQTRDDQRQLLHRLALAESTPSRGDALRRRIAAIVGGRAEGSAAMTLATDCCPA